MDTGLKASTLRLSWMRWWETRADLVKKGYVIERNATMTSKQNRFFKLDFFFFFKEALVLLSAKLHLV